MPKSNVLYFGDNFELLKEYIKDETIDLIYLDPPFNSNANYNVIFQTPKKEDSPSQIQAFQDTWTWNDKTSYEFNQLLGLEPKLVEVMKGLKLIIGKNDLLAYLTMMAIRIRELHRVLKETGSLYLHCDPTASHYLKLILDAVFEMKHFRREIVWDIAVLSGYKTQARNWIRGHDTILYYSKSDEFTFNKLTVPHRPEYIKRFNKTDEEGRKYFGGRGKRRYLDEVIKKGKSIGDVWSDIMSFQQAPTAKEKMGYPTQKPLSLLERIVKASSNEGDVILDPFCGCGTAIVASQRLNRNWIGMDITHLAIGLMEKRIYSEFGIKPKVVGNPASFTSSENLFKRSPLDFERWAVTRIEGIHPNKAQVGDEGIDGRGYLGPESQYKTIVSVKGGKQLNPAMVRELVGTVAREDASFGVLITIHNPTKGMKEEAAKAGVVNTPLGYHFPKIQIYTISDYFNGRLAQLPRNV